MQKKIIVLAIAAALTAPALALADTANVSIYGVVDASYDFVTTGDQVPTNNATKGTSEQRVSSNQSYIGLKGSSDLGGGLSAIWQVEGAIQVRGYSAAPFAFDRNTYAGLSSTSLGTVVVGRLDSPYSTSTRKLDVFADSIADNRALMGGAQGYHGPASSLYTAITSTSKAYSSAAAFDGRNAESLAYISPSFSGFSVQAGYVNGTAQNTLDTDLKITALSLAGMYDVAPFYAGAGWEQHSLAWGTGSGNPNMSETAMKLGGGYTMDKFSVGFVVEHTSDDFGKWFGATSQNMLGHNAWTLNGKFNVSASDAVKAAYTSAGNRGSSKDDSAKQFALGYDHSMGKTTTVYAIYTKISNDKNTNYALFGGDAYNNNTGPTGNGASPTALSLGVKHSF